MACPFQKLGRGEMSEDDDPFGKGTGEARDDIAAMDRQDATLVSILPSISCKLIENCRQLLTVYLLMFWLR